MTDRDILWQLGGLDLVGRNEAWPGQITYIESVPASAAWMSERVRGWHRHLRCPTIHTREQQSGDDELPRSKATGRTLRDFLAVTTADDVPPMVERYGALTTQARTSRGEPVDWWLDLASDARLLLDVAARARQGVRQPAGVWSGARTFDVGAVSRPRAGQFLFDVVEALPSLPPPSLREGAKSGWTVLFYERDDRNLEAEIGILGLALHDVPASHRSVVACVLNRWLDVAGVRPAVRWAGGEMEHGMIGGGFMGYLGRELIRAIEANAEMVACAGCGELFAPTRRQAGRRSWCASCGGGDGRRAAADRKRRQRASVGA